MKNHIYLLLFLFLTALAFGSCGKATKKAEEIDAVDAIAVKVAAVQNTDAVATVLATGLISTENEARYSFKIGGIIEKIAVNEGSFFKKGQLLGIIKITEIEAQLSQANLAFDKAKRDFTRASNLYKDSVATLEQFENAKTGMDVAQKNVDLLTFNKKYTSIYAAADGFVTKKLANEGEVIGAGMPILAINETQGKNDWVLKLGMSDRDWASIAEGNKAKVTIDAFPDKIFSGFVFRKSLAADPNSGSFQAEIKLTIGTEKMALGMFGKTSIELGGKTTFRIVPYDAVVEANGNDAFVFIPQGENKVKRIPIVIESFNNQHVVVKSGLENISSIVVSNSAFLNDNSTIIIVK